MMAEYGYKVGIYCRLSRDDGNDSTSMSIENQRTSLIQYVKDHNWTVTEIYEDDGYTGTNFNRPGFMRMINDIESRKINCVITKDLSRLGRNYIETGRYIEEYFPNNDIRYIAINDNFDTKEENEFAPFKNIINEWYAKDISKKVKFSMNQLMKRPKVIGSGVPLYGYIHSEEGERIPDPETAPIVRRIVNDYINGKTTVKIASELQQEGVYSPAYYYYLKYNYKPHVYSKFTDMTEKCKWSSTNIARMLRNVEYTGKLINHKYVYRSFKNKKKILVPEEERYVFDDVFEPLITKEEHEILVKMLDDFRKERIPEEENCYQSLLRCGACGSTLKYQRKTETGRPTRYLYQCRNKKCNCRVNIKVSHLDIIFANELEYLKDSILKCKDQFLEFASSLNDEQIDTVEQELETLVKKLKTQLIQLDEKIEALFEAHFADEIPTSTYEKLIKKYKEEKEIVERKLKEVIYTPKAKEDNLSIAEKIILILSEITPEEYRVRSFIMKIFESVTIIRNNKENKICFNYYGSKIIKEFMKCKQSPQST